MSQVDILDSLHARAVQQAELGETFQEQLMSLFGAILNEVEERSNAHHLASIGKYLASQCADNFHSEREMLGVSKEGCRIFTG